MLMHHHSEINSRLLLLEHQPVKRLDPRLFPNVENLPKRLVTKWLAAWVQSLKKPHDERADSQRMAVLAPWNERTALFRTSTNSDLLPRSWRCWEILVLRVVDLDYGGVFIETFSTLELEGQNGTGLFGLLDPTSLYFLEFFWILWL
jgi:hypothetical protein